MTTFPPGGDPWTWPEATWRSVVDHVRAGRSLKPQQQSTGGALADALRRAAEKNGRGKST